MLNGIYILTLTGLTRFNSKLAKEGYFLTTVVRSVLRIK